MNRYSDEVKQLLAYLGLVLGLLALTVVMSRAYNL